MKLKVPARIIITGDKDTGQLLIGYAKSQLIELEHQMKLATPRPLNEGFRTIKPFPGVVIEAWSSFSLHDVRIHVEPGVYRPEVVVDEKEKGRYCPCYPHFSIARIRGVSPEEPVQQEGETNEAFAVRWDDWTESLLNTEFAYDIEVCAKDKYILLIGATDPNFGRYNVGQVVVVTLGEKMVAWDEPLDCGRGCLMMSPRFDEIVISPIHNASGMRRWRESNGI